MSKRVAYFHAVELPEEKQNNWRNVWGRICLKIRASEPYTSADVRWEPMEPDRKGT